MKGFKKAAEDLVKKVYNDNLAELSAAISYYALLSLGPLIVLFITITSVFLNVDMAKKIILDEATYVLGRSAVNVVHNVFENAQPMTSIVSLVMLVAGATAVFQQVRGALNKIFDVKGEMNLIKHIRQRFLALASFFGGLLVMILLIISTAVTTTLREVSSEFLSYMSEFIFFFLLAAIVFTLTYKYLSETRLPFMKLLSGGASASLLFNVVRQVMGIYLRNTRPGDLYGAGGNILVLMIWVYVSSFIFLLGAEISLLGHEHADK